MAIACQGPLSNTTNHFWNMVDEQDVTYIFMLCKCIEKGSK